MHTMIQARRTLLALVLSCIAAGALAQAQPAAKPEFQPEVGQAGKDVVWVPTPQAVVDRMLDLARVGAQDVVFDLGSGDGRTVITAAKRGARSFGIEYNPDMVELSKRNAAAAKVSADRATFVQADLFETDFSKANVVTLFLLPSINMKLRDKILAMAPGTRIVPSTFRVLYGLLKIDLTDRMKKHATVTEQGVVVDQEGEHQEILRRPATDSTRTGHHQPYNTRTSGGETPLRAAPVACRCAPVTIAAC